MYLITSSGKIVTHQTKLKGFCINNPVDQRRISFFQKLKIKHMNSNKIYLGTTVLLSFLSICDFSCQKEVSHSDSEITTEAQTTAQGNRPDDPGFAENDMVMYWNEKAAIVNEGRITNPLSKAYRFAMIEIAVHDALNSIKPKFQCYALTGVREKKASPDAAVASAAYWSIKLMNLQSAAVPLSTIDRWYNESLANIPDGEAKELGIALGKQSAEAIIANRSSDNFAAAIANYPLADGVAPGEYRSTLPFSNPGQPKTKVHSKWGVLLKPFAVESNSQFRPGAPYAVNSPEYTADFNETKSKGALVGHNRTAEETEMGIFWSETFSFSWNRFARNALQIKKMDAWKTARLFALLHTAIIDATCGVFEAKYHYFFWRPETAIRLADIDGNPNTVGDANWLPSYPFTPNPSNPAMTIHTPPNPHYPAAWPAYGGAATEVMRLLFETDHLSIDQTSPGLPGVTRHYSSFSQAARENTVSRIYVGYQFRTFCMAGEEQGNQIGNYVFNHRFQENEDE